MPENTARGVAGPDLNAIAWTTFDAAWCEYGKQRPGEKISLMRRQKFALQQAVNAVSAAISLRDGAQAATDQPAEPAAATGGLPEVLRRPARHGARSEMP